ncbi:TIGR02444 family protein [Larsenimonas rhizosphaerae]|uniref:TIGR02444 family protein n=1 Tax=Larsenimonas rhizosphaerae TaxID=2944682 RepID=A0AA42CYG6_9GAMM|nr:TIGR02444 family protein [Larsenimonas rhizosphaerae]MCM2131533.1 TIGR02444 family protein [Larsenimonas rhizosphaerae]MCX2525140.1 TIGR02444 family protein [Larsenimonas rhizosphaerae]
MTDHSTQLWHYALRLYAKDGVQALCLDLQENAGLDVCELLWLCWLDQQGLTLNNDWEAALAGVRRWQHDMTLPLRRCRQALKGTAAHSPLAHGIREQLKVDELDSEREALTRLDALKAQENAVRRKAHGESLETSLARWAPGLSLDSRRLVARTLAQIQPHAEPGTS